MNATDLKRGLLEFEGRDVEALAALYADEQDTDRGVLARWIVRQVRSIDAATELIQAMTGIARKETDE